MFVSSKSPPLMSSGGATCFPDLSLQLTPPLTNKRSDLTQENNLNKLSADIFDEPAGLSLGLEIGALDYHGHPNITTPVLRWQPQQQHHRYHLPRIYAHDFRTRFRRNTRAPRMRWTSRLHALFIHAVHLLGGHQRATPKSVQELMNVKDLTLAHVKSHLQMYRTVKGSDKVAGGLVADDQMQVINSKSPLSFLEVRGGISESQPTDHHALESQSWRRSWTSSTNDSHHPMKESLSSDHCPSPITNDSNKADEVEVVTLPYLSKKMKLRSDSLSLTSEKSLNLEFTLGMEASRWPTHFE